MSVDCDVGRIGLEVRVRYGSSIENTDNPAAAIIRARVFMDGALMEDSGPIYDRIYVREASFPGASSRLHTVQVRIETRAAPNPGDFIQFAQCPPAPDTPLARHRQR
jgi:hypothetical protein